MGLGAGFKLSDKEKSKRDKEREKDRDKDKENNADDEKDETKEKDQEGNLNGGVTISSPCIAIEECTRSSQNTYLDEERKKHTVTQTRKRM